MITIETSLFAVWAYRVGAALLFLVGSWVIGKALRRSIERAGARLPLGPVRELLGGSAKFAAVTVGVITALGTLGVDVSALVAGLGLTGFALGFALRDLIANLLAGVMILIFRPFELSQRINVAGFEGHVAAIDLRYTRLHGENRDVLIPNSRIFTDPVIIVR